METASKEFARTLATRARARAQQLVHEGHRIRTATPEQAGGSLERRIDSVRRAARAAGSGSRIGAQVPKT